MLPDSRNTTYAPLSQVKSFDLNDIQDAIVAIKATQDIVRSSLNADKVMMIPSSMAQGINDGSAASPQFGQFTLAWAHTGAGGSQYVYCPVPLHVGQQIKAIKINGHEGASDEFESRIFEVRNDILIGGSTLVGAAKVSGTSGNRASVLHNAADGGAVPLPHTLIADRYYRIEIELTGPGTQFISAEVTYRDLPAI